MAAFVFAVAACGGGSDTQTVRGEGFTFEAPAGWDAEPMERGAAVVDDGRLVSVTTFRLRRAYTPELWPRVVLELDRVARQAAQRDGGTVTASRTVVVVGRRARQYDVLAGEVREQYTFVLRGHTEYQLLCRDAGDACGPFVASFRLS